MQMVNIHEAKTQLSRWIEQLVKWDSFVIAKTGKPLVYSSARRAPSAGQIQSRVLLRDRSPFMIISTAWEKIELHFGIEE